jgi:hypothetical protein
MARFRFSKRILADRRGPPCGPGRERRRFDSGGTDVKPDNNLEGRPFANGLRSRLSRWAQDGVDRERLNLRGRQLASYMLVRNEGLCRPR